MVDQRQQYNGVAHGVAQRSQSQMMGANKRTQEEMIAKVQENKEKDFQLLAQKTAASNVVFQNTRVCTGSKVIVKNGLSVVVGFNQQKKPQDLSKMRSSETSSFAQDTFKVRPNLHAGMTRKPLERYHPNAARSRLPRATTIMPYKNSSQIVIGDRSSSYGRQFMTTTGSNFANPKHAVTSNPGITSEITKRQKNAIAQ